METIEKTAPLFPSINRGIHRFALRHSPPGDPMLGFRRGQNPPVPHQGWLQVIARRSANSLPGGPIWCVCRRVVLVSPRRMHRRSYFSRRLLLAAGLSLITNITAPCWIYLFLNMLGFYARDGGSTQNTSCRRVSASFLAISSASFFMTLYPREGSFSRRDRSLSPGMAISFVFSRHTP